ncbi:hypothetical protein H112_04264 [Trichophyton rubrum D6]|uniref:Spo12 family protein n=5 Tax=Trichophyton TaxID=5550 RepID=A0A178F379_TRIRU|nr:uncharacterized protein TERG_04040 [Trichophyton rubrum CBS 118892]EZF22750.1 hypothetical protein H100_04270 [Trichophyton rubrum MR850]EZF42003.1 hypothetical protein H102_04256 [Trichophyton rubrum CBS 100081]EZF52708.1 hypothetical protein H103_04264 [Trichophyton rubrum CBS 288.86]EZF63209.1 hypothetical protein H104_04254 [Trichophyton rubrum CBS 289.86]EZF73942.1 hypothetical protein H105_04281 [Trichophyton soudanense CBS 452.61]EZF84543.1 hypothetical protein H110_04258 [Trichophy
MASITSPSKQPLSDRPTNTHLTMQNTSTEDCEADLKAATTKSMEYHRQVLKEKMEGDSQQSGHFISPSDGIMSPCTKKLSNLKGKKFKNAGRPQMLFAKALGKKSYDKMSSENAVDGDGTGDSGPA